MREEKDKEVPQGSTAVLETLPALQTPGHQVRYSRGCHQIGLPEPGDDHDGNETNMSGVTRWVILTVQKSTPSKIDQQPGLKLIQSKRKMQMADARKSLKRGFSLIWFPCLFRFFSSLCFWFCFNKATGRHE